MRDKSVLEPTFEQYVVPRDFNKSPIRDKGACGVATNDANYVTQLWELLHNGKRKLTWICPVYHTWYEMIKRGFSVNEKQKTPTYKDVSVCNEWLLFSNFRKWWIKNNVRGWQLDKDILYKGNLVYAPDKCAYIPRHINSLLIDSAAKRGEYPLGVYYDVTKNKFVAHVRLKGKQKHLGLFTSPQEAHKAWQIGKVTAIKDAITCYTEESTNLGVFDQRIVAALEGRIDILQDDIDNERKTLVLH